MIRFYQWLHHTHRALLWVFMALLGLSLVLWGSAQWWLLNQVENYRDQLVQQVQQETGIAVRVGHLSAASVGWMPGVRLEQIDILDAQGKTAVHIDEAEGRLSFSHLFLGRIDFGLLRLRHPVLTLIRKSGEQYYLSGLPLPKAESGSDFVLRQIFGQNRIRIQNLQMIWVDETAQDSSGVSLVANADLVNRGDHHILELGLDPHWGNSPAPLNFKLDFIGSDLKNFADWHGSVGLNRIELAAIDRVFAAVALPRLPQEQWQSIEARGVLQNLQVVVDRREAQPMVHVSMDLEQLFTKGAATFPPLEGLSGHVEGNDQEGALNLRGGNLPLAWLKVFSEPVVASQWGLKAHWKRDGDDTRIKLDSLKFANEDVKGEVSGGLSLTGKTPGKANLEAHLDQIVPGHAWRYLPNTIPKATRDWVKQSVAGGVVRDFTLNIDGDLQQFPFPQDQGGVFRISSRLNQVGLHFHEAWPAIEGIDGSLEFHGTEMVVKAQKGHIGPVELYPVTARIPDLDSNDPHLLISGGARGNTRDMLQFIQKSPVAGYINHATDGFHGDGLGVLGLNLDIPLNHSIDSTVGGNYQFVSAALTQPELNLPPLDQVNGHLIFSESAIHSENLEAQALGGKVTFRLESKPRGDVELQAEGSADMAQLAQIYHEPILAHVSGVYPWQGQFLFHRTGMEMKVDANALFLGEPAHFQLGELPGGMEVRLWGKTSAAAVARATHHSLAAELKGDLDWKGRVQVRRATSTLNLSVAGELFGKPLAATVTGSSRNWIVDANGAVATDTLNRLGFLAGMGKAIKGAADWKAHVEHQADGDHVSITSNLEGVSLALPAPMAKTSRERLAMAVRLDPASDNLSRFRLSFTDRASLELLTKELTPGALSHPVKGLLRLGNGSATMPASGFLIAGNLRQSSLDEWQKYISDSSQKEGESNRSTARSLPEPLRLDLQVENVLWKNRLWTSDRITGTLEAGTWNVRLQGQELQGSLTWVNRGDGQITGRFQRLVVPDVVTPEHSAARAASKTATAAHWPSLDLVAEHFTIRNHALGRFVLMARAENDVWKVQNLIMELSGGRLRAQGGWSDRRPEESQFNLQCDFDNLGDALNTLGYSKMVARGKGKLEAQLTWPASPLDFSTDLLSGHLTLDVKDGQFLKVNPGGQGRLIGLLSLQELPRHLTLDFHDVFSEGYAFDHLVTHTSLARGMMNLDDFVISSPSASVVMKGRLDLVNEQAHLSALVNPSLGNGVSLVASIINLPVGLISFAVQKLLKNPLDSAFSYQYLIDGSWSNPQMRSVKVGTPLD
jgi:uncharacterized protein YhdP